MATKLPLPCAAAFFAGGILLAHSFELSLVGLFALSFAITAAALLAPALRRATLPPLLFVLGALSLTLRCATLSSFDLRVVAGDTPQLATVEGTVRAAPRLRATEREGAISFRTTAIIDVRRILLHRRWLRASGAVAASAPGDLETFVDGGQPVAVTGVLKVPSGALADGLFDEQFYLNNQGIYFQLVTESAADWMPLGPPPFFHRWTARFQTWARRTLARDLGEEDEATRLIWAMTLGWNAALTGEISEPFMRTGTLHLFAISGLHVMLIASIWISLLRLLRLPRAIAGLITLPLLWFYAAATGFQASSIRATVMMSLIIGGWSLRRPSVMLNSLAAAALILLAADPLQLFQAGFQLSFSAVFGMAWLMPYLQRWLNLGLRPDPLVPEELRTRPRRWGLIALRYGASSVSVSAAALLSTAPLIATYFHLFTPISFVANLVMVPISALGLMSGMGSLIAGAWWPGLSGLLNNSAWFWMKCMIALSAQLSKIPGGYRYVSTPSWLTILLYYAALWALFQSFDSTRRKRALAVAGSALLIWGAEQFRARELATLTILPEGGSGLLFEPSRGETLLIDPGRASSISYLLLPFLRSRGINSLDGIALTQGDTRHAGGIEELSSEMPFRKIWTSAAKFRSEPYRRWLAGLEGTSHQPLLLGLGDNAGPWKVLHPSRDDNFSTGSDNAMVLYAEIGGVRVLLLSDLSRKGERRLLERSPRLQADVVVASIGAPENLLPDFLLKQIQPQALIIASADGVADERLDWRTRSRLNALGIPWLSAGEDGAVTLHFTPGRCEARPVRGESVITLAASDRAQKPVGRFTGEQQ